MPNHSYYKSDMMSRVIQVTHKKRTAKQMASMTVGFFSLLALLAFCFWCVS